MDYTAETPTSISELFSARQKLYQFLNLLFSRPIVEGSLNEIMEKGALEELKKLDSGGMLLADFLLTCKLDDLKNEQEEFCRLFNGPGSIVAPPWESYYTSKEKILFGESTLKVRETYRQYGLKYKHENRYPDDHLIIEIEYMMALNQECTDETSTRRMIKSIEKQLEFLEGHLAIWIPQFCDRIIACTDSKLYFGAASVLKDFILFDVDLLKEIKEELAYAKK